MFKQVFVIVTLALAHGTHGVALLSCGEGLVRHSVSDTASPCCHPLPYNCPQDYVYTLCGEDGGWDYCQACKKGYIQLQASNATHPMTCVKVENCPSEDEIPVGGLPCQCDWRQDKFPVFGGCERMHQSRQCAAGQERGTRGNMQDLQAAMVRDNHHNTYESCRPCPAGSFKNWSGPGTCIPVTNCEQMGQLVLSKYSLSSDNVCIPRKTDLVPADTKQPSTAVPGSAPTPPTNVEDSPSAKPDTEKAGFPDWLIVLAVVVLLLIFLVTVASVCWYRRRDQQSNRSKLCPCNPGETPGIELTVLRTQPTQPTHPTIPPVQRPLPPTPVPMPAQPEPVRDLSSQTDQAGEGHASEGQGHISPDGGTHIYQGEDQQTVETAQEPGQVGDLSPQTDQAGEGHASEGQGHISPDGGTHTNQGEGQQAGERARGEGPPIACVRPFERSGTAELEPFLAEAGEEGYAIVNHLGEIPVSNGLQLDLISLIGDDPQSPLDDGPMTMPVFDNGSSDQ